MTVDLRLPPPILGPGFRRRTVLRTECNTVSSTCLLFGGVTITGVSGWTFLLRVGYPVHRYELTRDGWGNFRRLFVNTHFICDSVNKKDFFCVITQTRGGRSYKTKWICVGERTIFYDVTFICRHIKWINRPLRIIFSSRVDISTIPLGPSWCQRDITTKSKRKKVQKLLSHQGKRYSDVLLLLFSFRPINLRLKFVLKSVTCF